MDSAFFDDLVGNLGSTCRDVDPLTLLHKRTGDSAVDILREAVRAQLFEGVSKLNIELTHFHSEGGSEFIAKEVLQCIHRSHVNTSHTSRDTPEMNYISERQLAQSRRKHCVCFFVLVFQ